MPHMSLVRNIGHDGTGLHCGINENLQNQPIVDYVRVVRIKKQLSSNGLLYVQDYYDKQEHSIKNRVLKRVYRLLGKNY